MISPGKIYHMNDFLFENLIYYEENEHFQKIFKKFMPKLSNLIYKSTFIIHHNLNTIPKLL